MLLLEDLEVRLTLENLDEPTFQRLPKGMITIAENEVKKASQREDVCFDWIVSLDLMNDFGRHPSHRSTEGLRLINCFGEAKVR